MTRRNSGELPKPPEQDAPLAVKLAYVDRVMGFLSGGPDLLEGWYKEHRLEGEHEDDKF